MSAVKLVTIREKVPLYKEKIPANAIELVYLEEVGNSVVVQKNLYEVGHKALFIEPDHHLSDQEIFAEYIAPGGDPKKSRLGKNNRIRAIKFNLHTGDNQPVYSYGILINAMDIAEYYAIDIHKNPNIDWDTKWGIIKYEEPEPEMKNGGSGNRGATTPFPNDMYKTDEININNIINDIVFPITLISSEKADGSSISIYYKNGKSGIASRKLGRPLTYKKCIGTKKSFWRMILSVITFGRYKPKRIKIYSTVENDDLFVVTGKPYLSLLEDYCRKNNVNLVLRGELCGRGCKGSGNPNNPKAKEEMHIEFFGIDDYTRHAKRLDYATTRKIAAELGLPFVHEYFNRNFESREELFQTCQAIFDEEERNGRLIEGVVLRHPETDFSCKLMSMSYDSKKA
ncbi:MAG: hypothetical protein LBE91_08170 [Tannerella sp.]|jgi:hypothetical protein|nr:hypothetical protein [Tannerella sp.]